MAKKNKKTDAILKRAEKLFNAGNFLLAEKEFEKIQGRFGGDEITEKLDICRKETRVVKGNDLVKQGQKAAAKGNFSQAISFFQGAEKLLNDPLITEKIKELQDRMNKFAMDIEASQAEASLDYDRASDLYFQAWETSNDQRFLLKSALCLVKAKAYARSVTLFEQLDKMDDNAIYCHGFALAKIGRHYEALTQWKNLDSAEKNFRAQARFVFSLACSDLYADFDKGFEKGFDGCVENEPKSDINPIYTRVKGLISMASDMDAGDLLQTLEPLYLYSKLLSIETLWKDEAFEDVAGLLMDLPELHDPAILSLNAKTYFHLAGGKADFLESMMNFWMTALYSREISARFSDNPETKQKIQSRLVRLAEQQINLHHNSSGARHAARILEIEKKLLQDLLELVLYNGIDFDRVCTPRYASMSGDSQVILDLIRKNKDYFKTREHYLETGAYYSRAGESLYALHTGELEKALTLVESSFSGDEFITYAVSFVQFKAGQAAIENNEKDYLQYFALTHELFESVPSIELKFVERMDEYYDDKAFAYEKVLTFIHKKRPSDKIAEALSVIMTQAAIDRYNSRQINDSQMKAVVQKALKIYPHNEFVIHNMQRVNIDLEVQTMGRAIEKNKFNKAARMACQSEYQEVVDHYFEFAEEFLAQVDQPEVDVDARILCFNELLSASMMVNPNHPLIFSIKQSLKRLGG